MEVPRVALKQQLGVSKRHIASRDTANAFQHVSGSQSGAGSCRAWHYVHHAYVSKLAGQYQADTGLLGILGLQIFLYCSALR